MRSYEERKKLGGILKQKTIEEINFGDIYRFPFTTEKITHRVLDADKNFVFQFQFSNSNTQKQILSFLNKLDYPKKLQKLKHENGMISIFTDEKWVPIILIRGWGNLTGIGSYNLDEERAAKIQDTLADYILECLTDIKI